MMKQVGDRVAAQKATKTGVEWISGGRVVAVDPSGRSHYQVSLPGQTLGWFHATELRTE